MTLPFHIHQHYLQTISTRAGQVSESRDDLKICTKQIHRHHTEQHKPRHATCITRPDPVALLNASMSYKNTVQPDLRQLPVSPTNGMMASTHGALEGDKRFLYHFLFLPYLSFTYILLFLSSLNHYHLPCSSYPYSSSTSQPPLPPNPHTYTIKVGAGTHSFPPQSLSDIPIGDIVTFEFYPPNHSVARAEYGAACVPYEQTGRDKVGFWSGVHLLGGWMRCVFTYF